MGLTPTPERLWKLSSFTTLPFKDYHTAAGPSQQRFTSGRGTLGQQPQTAAGCQTTANQLLLMQDCKILLWTGCPRTRSRHYAQSVESQRHANTISEVWSAMLLSWMKQHLKIPTSLSLVLKLVQLFSKYLREYAFLILRDTSWRCKLNPKQAKNVKETHHY